MYLIYKWDISPNPLRRGWVLEAHSIQPVVYDTHSAISDEETFLRDYILCKYVLDTTCIVIWLACLYNQYKHIYLNSKSDQLSWTIFICRIKLICMCVYYVCMYLYVLAYSNHVYNLCMIYSINLTPSRNHCKAHGVWCTALLNKKCRQLFRYWIVLHTTLFLLANYIYISSLCGTRSFITPFDACLL